MPCWVVPTIAAELWECHIDRITNAIRDGHLKTKEENGWMFVDVAPQSPVMETGKALWAGSPWANAVVSREEMEALSEPMVVQNDNPERIEVMAEREEQSEPETYQMDFGQPGDDANDEAFEEEDAPALHIVDDSVEEESDEAMADFRKVRQQVARKRIPPMVRTLAA